MGMVLATAAGVDSRLFYFIPLSTLFTVLTLSLLAWTIGDISLQAALGGWRVFLPFAVLLMPMTLPPALASWVLARLLFWKAGTSEHTAAALSGVISGLAAMAIPALMSPYTANALSGALVLGLVAGVSGGLAAYIVYWDGWKK